MKKVLVILFSILLALSGGIGAYGFITYGHENPLDYIFAGKHAPFLFVFILGVIVVKCWPYIGKNN